MTTTVQYARRLRAISMALALAIVLLPALAATPSAQAQTYSVLYNFTGGSDGGYSEYANLIQDKAGNLYGVASSGGTDYCGVVFKLTPSGTETVLWSFTCGADGGYPYATLAMGPSGELFGTAYYGGSDEAGVIFKVNPTTMTETVLHTFTGGSDGGYPFSGLTWGSTGLLYGMAEEGGANGDGVIFKFNPKTGTETVLHSFDYSDGGYPFSSTLTPNSAGSVFYGATADGGTDGCGVVFQINKAGTYTLLYNFTCGSDGAYPYGDVAISPGGQYVYGTTYYYGADYYGTVWKVTRSSGTFTLLYTFTGGADGGYPFGGAALSKGQLYGTTYYAGADDYGTVWQVNAKSGTETVLHSFDYSDGGYPFSGVSVLGGNLYGMTDIGGSGGAGVVYEIAPAKK